MKLEILGVGCPKCTKLFQNAETAMREAGVSGAPQIVTDIDKITDYGVMMTPAIVIDGVVKSSGKVLSVEEIKKLFA